MKKATIELDRTKGHWSNWGVMLDKWGGSSDTSIVLDALIEWTKRHPKAKVYRHSHRHVEENISKDPVTVKTLYDEARKVYLCDRVIYLDIYYQ